MSRRGSSQHNFPTEGLLTIGALSAATGIPIDTIRTWERRYGFPVPERKPSGHRVYQLSTVPRLRRAAQAIAQGHRAAEVVPASESALEALLHSLPSRLSPSQAATRPIILQPGEISAQLGDTLEAARAYDAETLKRRLEADWARLGPLAFLEHASAFLTALGKAWEEGDLEVRHEHFASGVVGDFLRAVRSPLEERATGPIAALATLPNELHGLGLQMAALVFSLAGWRPLVLGVDTPTTQVSAVAQEVSLAAVALSCIQPLPRRGVAALRVLRRSLPRRVQLLVGGHGAPQHTRVRGVEFLGDLAALDRWLRVSRA